MLIKLGSLNKEEKVKWFHIYFIQQLFIKFFKY